MAAIFQDSAGAFDTVDVSTDGYYTTDNDSAWTLDWTTGDYNFTDVPANVTEIPIKEQRLRLAYNILVAVNSAFITFTMGCGVEPAKLLPHVKRPYGPIIGIVCQCIIMPALCFGYAVAVDLQGEVAIGMLVTGSCPGGSLSNIFTYWSRGNLTLSVAMTVFSTTLSIGFLPLNMFIYTRYWKDEGTELPYINMVFSMAYTWVAAAIGMIIAWKAPKAAKWIAKVGSVCGVVFLVAMGVLQSQIYSDLFSVEAPAWAGALSMPIVGFVIGFAISSIFCLDLDKKKAIAYETGTQNVAVALTIITLSFDQEIVMRVSTVPMLYAFSQIVVGLVSSVIHQLYYRSKEDRFPFKHCAERRARAAGDITVPPPEGSDNCAYVVTEVVHIELDPDPGPRLRHPLPGTSTSPPRDSVLYADDIKLNEVKDS